MQRFIAFLFIAVLMTACKDEDGNNRTTPCCEGSYASFSSDSSAFLFVPNVFTPNGDGLNDLFNVYGNGIASYNQIVKLNGAVYFQSNDQSYGWDGTSNGTQSPEEQYDFELSWTDPSGTAHNLMGKVCLIISCLPDYTSLNDCLFGNQFDGSGFSQNLDSGESWLNPCN